LKAETQRRDWETDNEETLRKSWWKLTGSVTWRKIQEKWRGLLPKKKEEHGVKKEDREGETEDIEDKFLYGNSIGRRGKELLARYGILDLQFLLKKTANERWRWGVW
jgi:hypothetical protein